MKRLISMYQKLAWSIDNFLGLWFDDNVVRFRSIMALAGAIATGCQVIRFFDRDPPDERSHLDIVTRVGGVGAIVIFLEHMGYVLKADAPSLHTNNSGTMTQVFQLTSSLSFQAKTSANGVVAVMEFQRPTGDNYMSWSGPSYDRYTSVQLIVVTQNPVHHMLMHFHSSTYIRSSLRSTY